ncbi:TPA: hypothetical protein ACH3X1_015706 [Trebouxia sp. C0004]
MLALRLSLDGCLRGGDGTVGHKQGKTIYKLRLRVLRVTKEERKGAAPFEVHLQMQGIKKAKQFEVRKLIRRLKAAAAASIEGSESTAIKFAAATSKRLQAQYDTTKSLNTEVLLQQDAAASGQPSDMLSKELPEASDHLIQLACSRLLSATCVKQQIEAIKDQQQDQRAPVAKAQPTPSEVSGAAQQGPLSLEESGAETSTGPTAGLLERYSRDAAMSDNGAAQDAEEDRQIADAAMARLLDKRANAAEQSSTSASDNSAADLSQQSDASHGISCSEDESAEPDMAQSQQPDISPEAGPPPLQNKRKHVMQGNLDLPGPQKQKKQNGVHAGQKPKEMPKKKKNRLGQRARQQLGRAKQSQQMLHGPHPKPPVLKPHARQAAPGMKNTQVRAPAVTRVESKPPATGPVHPSWLAKQKQKQALLTAAPQGSKTVFSDDGQVMASSATHSPAATLPKSASKAPAPALKPAAARLTAAEAEGMHPSWIAKRVAVANQAELASGKKASKIIFDD